MNLTQQMVWQICPILDYFFYFAVCSQVLTTFLHWFPCLYNSLDTFCSNIAFPKPQVTFVPLLSSLHIRTELNSICMFLWVSLVVLNLYSYQLFFHRGYKPKKYPLGIQGFWRWWGSDSGGEVTYTTDLDWHNSYNFLFKICKLWF